MHPSDSKSVPYHGGEKEIVVWCLPWSKFRRFQQETSGLVAVAINVGAAGKSKEEIAASIAGLIPHLLEKFGTLIDECCAPRPSEVDPPAYVMPQIAEAWFSLNFLRPEARSPWVSFLGRLVEMCQEATGMKSSESNQSLSKLATVARNYMEQSSTTDAPTKGTPAAKLTDSSPLPGVPMVDDGLPN